MPIKGVAYRIVVKPDPVVEEREVTTNSGLVIKLQLQVDHKIELMASTMGTIVEIGDDVYSAFKPKRPNAGLVVGDRVYFSKYAGQWIKNPKTGEELLILNDEDITAKYVEDIDDEQKDSAPVVAS